jgi:tRNA pseudouridine38-40 synthase
MARYGATLAYDGTAYYGFQRQAAHLPTIQLVVEASISNLARQQVTIIGAGRTDTGVHAVGQVIAFDLEWKHSETALLLAINSQLPADIALQRIWQQDGFHPRYDALSRQYLYTVVCLTTRNPLLNRQAWQLLGNTLDYDVMQTAAEQLIGKHDFGAFGTPPQTGSTNTIREVYLSQWTKVSSDFGETFTYRIRATAFLYHMVRRIVGTLVQVGRKRLTLEEFSAIVASRDVHQTKLLAPPQGLVFEAVRYPQHKTATPIATETSE